MQLLIVWCCYQEIVHVIDGAFCQNISELSIDHALEYSRGVSESERVTISTYRLILFILLSVLILES